MAIYIKELNHVALHVRDLAASMHFYGDILGLPSLPRPAFNFPGAWYAFGNQELHLIQDDNLQPEKRRHHHYALLVEDAFGVRTDRGFLYSVTASLVRHPRVPKREQKRSCDPTVDLPLIMTGV